MVLFVLSMFSSCAFVGFKAYLVVVVVIVNVKGVTTRHWAAVGPRCPSVKIHPVLIVPRRENKTISDKYINIHFRFGLTLTYNILFLLHNGSEFELFVLLVTSLASLPRSCCCSYRGRFLKPRGTQTS